MIIIVDLADSSMFSKRKADVRRVSCQYQLDKSESVLRSISNDEFRKSYPLRLG